jgi:hypothetical protein
MFLPSGLHAGVIGILSFGPESVLRLLGSRGILGFCGKGRFFLQLGFPFSALCLNRWRIPRSPTSTPAWCWPFTASGIEPSACGVINPGQMGKSYPLPLRPYSLSGSRITLNLRSRITYSLRFRITFNSEITYWFQNYLKSAIQNYLFSAFQNYLQSAFQKLHWFQNYLKSAIQNYLFSAFQNYLQSAFQKLHWFQNYLEFAFRITLSSLILLWFITVMSSCIPLKRYPI